MKIGVKFVVVIKKEELDLEGTKELLSNYGTIFEMGDDDLDGTPVKLFYIDSDFGKFTKIKLELLCVTAPYNDYILFPMMSYEDKKKVMEERRKEES